MSILRKAYHLPFQGITSLAFHLVMWAKGNIAIIPALLRYLGKAPNTFISFRALRLKGITKEDLFEGRTLTPFGIPSVEEQAQIGVY